MDNLIFQNIILEISIERSNFKIIEHNAMKYVLRSF